MLLKIKNAILFVILLYSGSTVSCKKYLEAKPNQQLVIPTTVRDLQSLLDNYAVINHNNPATDEICSDNYYVTTADFNALRVETERRTYLWEKENLFLAGNSNDWARTYNKLNYANIVLNEINKIFFV